MGIFRFFYRKSVSNEVVLREKEQLLWVRDFITLKKLAGALKVFRQRYNDHWLMERLSFQSPRQASQRRLALEAAA